MDGERKQGPEGERPPSEQKRPRSPAQAPTPPPILTQNLPTEERPAFFSRLGNVYGRQRAEVLFIGSFLLAILIGAALLSLPQATPMDRPIGFVDALFTATSATCVTGLVVRDTGTEFTRFGQSVILVLIQVGGLGIMTISASLFYLLGQRVRRRESSALVGLFSGHEALRPSVLIRGIIVVALIVEGLGAWLLYGAMGAHDGQPDLFKAVFHSVSASCNAGFALQSDSLTAYRGVVGVNVVIMLLIVLGGLGFAVLLELWRGLFRRSRPENVRYLSLHTRIVLSSSAILVGGGMAVFLIFERGHALAGMGSGERLLAAMFQSVTTRTAGFNTIDFADLRPATLFLVLLFMFIGGSPGSTAGGVKTTTAVIAMATLLARVRGRKTVTMFKRTVPEHLCTRALMIFLVSFLLLSVAILLLALTEAHNLEGTHGREHFLDLLFETVSAFGTVGLSTGWTPNLSDGGKLLIMALMFAGRVGPLTLATALGEHGRPSQIVYPEGRIMIG